MVNDTKKLFIEELETRQMDAAAGGGNPGYLGPPVVTTLSLGEEDGKSPPVVTTLSLCEETGKLCFPG